MWVSASLQSGLSRPEPAVRLPSGQAKTKDKMLKKEDWGQIDGISILNTARKDPACFLALDLSKIFFNSKTGISGK
jgi:hypothetical protein